MSNTIVFINTIDNDHIIKTTIKHNYVYGNDVLCIMDKYDDSWEEMISPLFGIWG